MALSNPNRVREQVSSFSGTGNVTLPVVAVTGFQTFLAGYGASGGGFVCLVQGAQWEVCAFTINAGGTLLTRGAVDSSSTGSQIAFSGGTLDCFGCIPGSKLGQTAAGSVGAPAHSFLNDPDCGMWLVGANNIGLGVNGVEAIDITTSLVSVLKPMAMSYASSGGGYSITNSTNMAGTGNPDFVMAEASTGASTWYFANFRSAAGADNEFLFRGDGTGLCDGSWTGGGADYAEFFEWSDSNPDNEDRRGMSVVLTGAKVRIAVSTDPASAVIGVVSARPTVVGDAAPMRWKDQYLRDDYGAEIMEEAPFLSWIEHREIEKPVAVPEAQLWRAATLQSAFDPGLADDNTPEFIDIPHRYFEDSVPEGVSVPDDAVRSTEQRRQLNPHYDPQTKYVPREERPEWSPIGLMGKLIIRKGQPVGQRWIKLRDVSATAEQWLVR